MKKNVGCFVMMTLLLSQAAFAQQSQEQQLVSRPSNFAEGKTGAIATGSNDACLTALDRYGSKPSANALKG